MSCKLSSLVLAVAMAFAAEQVQAVTDVFNMGPGLTSLEMVPVGNAGNTADDTGFGAVDTSYNIGKYEVTAGQYTAFLNAVATTSDTYELYNAEMWNNMQGCKIQQTNSSGIYSYSVAQDYANRPVNYVSFCDAARFTNWLHNGQGNGSTEDGAYTLTSDGITNNTRNTDAKYWVPSLNEWYKAAYHMNNGVTGGAENYWNYPTGSDGVPTAATGGMVAGTAVFKDNSVTPAGPADVNNSGGLSAYGTMGQGGNVWELNESILDLSSNGLRGGVFNDNASFLLSSCHNDIDAFPKMESFNAGFRVASVPEPGSITLLVAGAIAGLVWWQPRKPA